MSDERPNWLRQADTDPDTVAGVYDTWAATYDRDLADWGYEAPALAARALATACQPDPGGKRSAPVLDVGCGTGLVGRELQAAGFDHVDGLDLSPRSLELAGQTGLYRNLHQADLQTGTIPSADAGYAALVCIGVMTYLPDTTRTVQEFCRVVQAGGPVVFTQRHDLWQERADLTTLEQLQASGVCSIHAVSDPLPYLPGNAELGDIPAVLVELRAGPGDAEPSGER